MNYDHAPLDNEQSNQTPADYEPKEVRTFMYGSSRVPVLTADELNDVEQDVYREGVTPEQGQEIIYRKLESMGLKLEDLQGGAVVVDFTGADGKTDRRAMVVDYSDFGTRVVGADLVEREPEEQEEAVDDVEQEHLLEAAIHELQSRVGRVESHIAGAAYDANVRRQEIYNELAPLKSLLVGMRLGGQPDLETLQQLVGESLPNAHRYATDLATEADTEKQMVNNLVDSDVDETRTEGGRKLDEGRRAKLDMTLRTADSALSELRINRKQMSSTASGVVETIESIARAANEMLSSSTGHEYYASRLEQLASEIEDQMARTNTLASNVPELIADVKNSLVTQ